MSSSRLAVLFIVLSLSSCSQSPAKAILGAWQENGGSERLEFFKDGTLAVNGAIAGEYSFLDEKRLKLNLSGWGALAGPQMFTVTVSKTDLSLTHSSGKISTYGRAVGNSAPLATPPAQAGSPSSEREQVKAFRAVVREWVDVMAAKAPDAQLREVTIALEAGMNDLKNTSVAELQYRAGEGKTKGNLGAIRSALSIYYGDQEGVYPDDLAALLKNGKYLSSLPEAVTGIHPASNAVVKICPEEPARDTGGWAYCAKRRSPNQGTIVVDCTHTDSRKLVWNKY